MTLLIGIIVLLAVFMVCFVITAAVLACKYKYEPKAVNDCCPDCKGELRNKPVAKMLKGPITVCKTCCTPRGVKSNWFLGWGTFAFLVIVNIMCICFSHMTRVVPPYDWTVNEAVHVICTALLFVWLIGQLPRLQNE